MTCGHCCIKGGVSWFSIIWPSVHFVLIILEKNKVLNLSFDFQKSPKIFFLFLHDWNFTPFRCPQQQNFYLLWCPQQPNVTQLWCPKQPNFTSFRGPQQLYNNLLWRSELKQKPGKSFHSPNWGTLGLLPPTE